MITTLRRGDERRAFDSRRRLRRLLLIPLDLDAVAAGLVAAGAGSTGATTEPSGDGATTEPSGDGAPTAPSGDGAIIAEIYKERVMKRGYGSGMWGWKTAYSDSPTG